MMKLKPLLIAGSLAAASSACHAQTSLDDVTGLLLKQDYAALETTFANQQTRFERGELTDYELRKAFKPFEDLTDTLAMEKLREWAARSPASYVAHLALGLHYREEGNVARGRKFWDSTPQEQQEGLVRNFTLAEPELRASLPLTGKPYLSALNLMTIAAHMSNRPMVNASLMLANESSPGNELARLHYARYLLPRWGGTYEKLDAFIALSRSEGVPESTLLKMQAIGLQDRGQVLAADRHRTRAEPLFRQALQLARQSGNEHGFRASYLASAVKHICKDGAQEPVCEPAGPVAAAQPPSPTFNGPLGGDVEHAIVVPTGDSFEGVRTEYAWLALRYPAAKRTAQALLPKNGRQYDVLSVTTKDGQKLTLYFDITAFYGNYLKPKEPAKTQEAGAGNS